MSKRAKSLVAETDAIVRCWPVTAPRPAFGRLSAADLTTLENFILTAGTPPQNEFEHMAKDALWRGALNVFDYSSIDAVNLGAPILRQLVRDALRA